MKFIGVLFVVGGTTILGFWLAMENKKKVNYLQEIVFFWESLVTEISYGYSPLPQAMENAARSLRGPLFMMIKKIILRLNSGEGNTAADIWCEEIDKYKKILLLAEEEVDILKHWGVCLGNSDMEDQLRKLHFAKKRLQIRENLLQAELKTTNKLFCYLGFIAGAMLVLFLY